MQRIFLTVFIFSILLSCGQISSTRYARQDTLFFRTQITPAFDEPADIILIKTDTAQTIKIILTEAHGNDKPVGVFYSKSISLSRSQFNKLDSELFPKIIATHSIEKKVRDGIGFRYSLFNKSDTTLLTFATPSSSTDPTVFRLIENSLDNFRSIFKDSIISEYLDDIDTYIDYSKKDLLLKGNRAIDSLRKIKYNR